MSQKIEALVVWVIAATFATLLLVGITEYLSDSKWMTSQTPANIGAWTQAVGSIGAIVGTWYAARYQFVKQLEEQKRQQRENNRIFAKLVKSLSERAFEEIVYVCDVMEQRIADEFADESVLMAIAESLRILEGKGLRASHYEYLISVQLVIAQTIHVCLQSKQEFSITIRDIRIEKIRADLDRAVNELADLNLEDAIRAEH